MTNASIKLLNVSSVIYNETYYEPCTEHPPIVLYWFVTNGVVMNILGLFGIIGNIISMIILSRPQMRSSINYFLIVLARIDTVLIITSILLFGLASVYPYTGYMYTFYYNVHPHITPWVYPLAMVAQIASAYTTVMVSMDRFVAVCLPLRARSLCTYGRARIYVIGILVFSLLYNIPRWWEITIQSDWHPETNITVYCVRPTPLRNNETYLIVYVNWCYLIFVYLIPFLSLTTLNMAIYRQVRKANKERQRLSRVQRREIGLATMLLCVVIVFFACNFLSMMVNITECFPSLVDPIIYDHMVKTSNLLVTINSSVNFLIYVTFGEKFKRLFLVLFCSHGFFSTSGGRDSPEGATTHDDSFISNGGGDRQSLRLHRHNTNISRNGTTIRLNGTVRENRKNRSRASSPSPCVYYPANRTNKDTNAVAYTTQMSVPSTDWERMSTSSDF